MQRQKRLVHESHLQRYQENLIASYAFLLGDLAGLCTGTRTENTSFAPVELLVVLGRNPIRIQFHTFFDAVSTHLFRQHMASGMEGNGDADNEVLMNYIKKYQRTYDKSATDYKVPMKKECSERSVKNAEH